LRKLHLKSPAFWDKVRESKVVLRWGYAETERDRCVKSITYGWI
jgi:hypothetical protein